MLSQTIYEGKGEYTENLLKSLGYDYVWTNMANGVSSYEHPLSCIGYKGIVDQAGKKKNIFVVVVRGSREPYDFISDAHDSLKVTMWETSRDSIRDDLTKYAQAVTKKTLEQLESEENYFFFTGHSWGAATVNALSVENMVYRLSNKNKNRIYTYTYESPNTCVYLWWRFWNSVDDMSHAFNIKDSDDGVTKVPARLHATTYGKDLTFTVHTLDNSIFETLFPDAKGGNVIDAPSAENYGDIFGHHDLGLDLVYVLQHGIEEGWWDSVEDVVAPLEYKLDSVEDVLDSVEDELDTVEDELGSTEDVSQSSSPASDFESIVDEDVSAYGIPNGNYVSTDGYNQVFEFYGQNGIVLSVFGISFDGSYEVKDGKIIVTYDFPGLGMRTWAPTFSMDGDSLYIAETEFIPEWRLE